MPKIKFTKPYQVKGTAFQAKRQNLPVAEDPDDSPAYTVGQVVEVSDASARHFVNRGVAEVVGGPKAFKAAAPVAAEPEADAAPDYEAMTVEELHKVAADRNLEGRGGLNKADTIKLIEKDDKAKAKAAAAKPK